MNTLASMKRDIPIYCSTSFQWKQGRATAERSEFDFVSVAGRYGYIGKKESDYSEVSFYVKSARTGNLSLFTYVPDEDGYDGEMEVYRNEQGNFITIFND